MQHIVLHRCESWGNILAELLLLEFEDDLGEFALELREECKLTQKEAADCCGQTRSNISRYEGSKNVPNPRYLACLARYIVEETTSGSQSIDECKQFLLKQINAANRKIRNLKKTRRRSEDTPYLSSWEELERFVDQMRKKEPKGPKYKPPFEEDELRGVLEKILTNFSEAQILVEKSIEFVQEIFPQTFQSAIFGTLIPIIEKLIDYIKELNHKGAKIELDEIIRMLAQFIEEAMAEKARHEHQKVNWQPLTISFEDKAAALQALEKIADNQQQIFRNIIKRIAPDLIKSTKAISDKPEFETVVREELTKQLIQLKDETDLLKQIMGFFDIIHAAGISYTEAGISGEDVVEVAEALKSLNILEEQKRQLRETLDNYGLDVEDKKVTIARIREFTERTERNFYSRLQELELIIAYAQCLDDEARSTLFKEIIQLLEEKFNIKIKAKR